jgi:hypothetical protein
MKSLAIRMNIKLGALEADGTSVRIICAYDRRPAGADAGVLDMLVADDLLSPYNTIGGNKGRFQFIFDRVITFDANQGEWNDMFFIKKTMKIGYEGNAGTVADVQKGNFLLMGLSRGNAAAISIDFGYMFKYVDD